VRSAKRLAFTVSRDERAAHVEAAKVVATHVADAQDQERVECERRARGVTFREVAHSYLGWLKETKGGRSPLDYGYLLAEPGVQAKRGRVVTQGRIMQALGDRPAVKIATREVEALLKTVARGGGSARSVNKHRSLLSAIFNYGMRESTFGLPANPAAQTDKRREPQRDVLAFYAPEEVEALARALQAGTHRDLSRPAVSEEERAVRALEDQQDAVLGATRASLGRCRLRGPGHHRAACHQCWRRVVDQVWPDQARAPD
jgi:hypothetical protein